MRLLRRAIALLFTATAGCSLIIDGQVVSVHCDDEGAYGQPACPDGYGCHAGLCVEGPAPHALGRTCSLDTDCLDGDFCLDPSDFQLDSPTAHQRRCSRPCCSSGDCDPQPTYVCWSPALGGGNFCLEKGEIGRTTTGAANAGEPCQVDADCRSGACEGNRCDDPCCSDTNCATGGETCHLDEVQAGSLRCNLPVSGKATYEPCMTDADCVSRLCIDLGGSLRCSTPCCASDACDPHFVSGMPVDVACIEIVHHETVVRACAAAVQGREAAVGEPCKGDADCRSMRCVKGDADGAYCDDVCCADSDCGDETTFACRPTELTVEGLASWVLRCHRK